MPDNLWGEIPNVENIKTPHAILLEQASLLTELTKGLLTGGVGRNQGGNMFTSTLGITAPALNNYSYAVVQINYPISLYPLTFIPLYASSNISVQLNDEAAFLAKLKEALASPQVKRVIAGLLAQIRADSEVKRA